MKQNHNHKLFEKNNSKDNVEIEDHLLCLPCIIRRDLYNKAKLALPRSIRKQGTDNWPLKGSQTIYIDKLNPSFHPAFMPAKLRKPPVIINGVFTTERTFSANARKYASL
jgi:hypothetical protein